MIPIDNLLGKRPHVVYLHQNKPLQSTITDLRIMLRKSTDVLTRCRELVVAWPDYVGIKCASKEGTWGIVVEELK